MCPLYPYVSPPFDSPPPPSPGKIQVLEHLLKAVRVLEPTDKVVIVSNYTESLDMLQKAGAVCWGTHCIAADEGCG